MQMCQDSLDADIPHLVTLQVGSSGSCDFLIYLSLSSKCKKTDSALLSVLL